MLSCTMAVKLTKAKFYRDTRDGSVIWPIDDREVSDRHGKFYVEIRKEKVVTDVIWIRPLRNVMRDIKKAIGLSR